MATGEWLSKLNPGQNNLSKGDIIAYVSENYNQGYIKATPEFNNIIGVFDSNSINVSSITPSGDILDPDTNEPIIFENNFERCLYTHIPTAISGITLVKFTGKSEIGGYITISDIAGVGKLSTDVENDIIFAEILEDYSNSEDIRLVTARLINRNEAKSRIQNKVNIEKLNEISEVLNTLLFNKE